jgi:hypothetical protein
MRLVLPWRDSLRAILWIRVGHDGSVYAGTPKLYAEIQRSARRRDGQPLPNGIVEDSGPLPFPKDFHASFHASGVIHVAGARSFRKALNTPGIHQLFHVDLASPEGALEALPRPRDVVLPHQMSGDRGLRILVSRVPEASVMFVEEVPVQSAVILDVIESRELRQPVHLQLSLLEQSHGWSVETQLVWVSPARGAESQTLPAQPPEAEV